MISANICVGVWVITMTNSLGGPNSTNASKCLIGRVGPRNLLLKDTKSATYRAFSSVPVDAKESNIFADIMKVLDVYVENIGIRIKKDLARFLQTESQQDFFKHKASLLGIKASAIKPKVL